jgi:hypothetical protein
MARWFAAPRPDSREPGDVEPDAQAGLFAAPPALPAPAEPATTAGQRRRARHGELVAAGQHPLVASLRYPIRLHSDAARSLDPADGGPRCGGCVHRRVETHHDTSYPKCYVDPIPREHVDERGKTWRWNDYPRITNGVGTDVRMYWPACTSWEQAP